MIARLAALFSLLAATLGGRSAGAQPPPMRADSVVSLKSRVFVPTPGVEPLLIRQIGAARRADRIHVIMQFRVMPNVERREELARIYRVRLLDAIPSRAFFAAMPPDSVLARRLAIQARWIGAIQPRDKVAPWLLSGGLPTPAGDARVTLIVEFFSDAPLDDQRRILRAHGLRDDARLELLNGWTARVHPDSIMRLAAEDAVQWIVDAPRSPSLDNDRVRGATGVNADAVLAPSAYNLSGSGVTVASWDWTVPSLNHEDLLARVTVGDPPVSAWNRSMVHDDAGATPNEYDAGEAIYVDMDDSESVSVSDVRITAVAGFFALTHVAAVDSDVGRVLVLFSNSERYVDIDGNSVFNDGDGIYRDIDDDLVVGGADTQLTPVGAASGAKLRNFPTDPHWHSTMVAGTLMGDGSRSVAKGGSPNQWKGVAAGATLRSYGVCGLTACSGTDWINDLINEHIDALSKGAVISSHPWGPALGHCHQRPAAETCYDVLSELYDAVASGRNRLGNATGLGRLLPVGSAGNAGRPERHTENVTANGQFDGGESIYIDFDGDGVVSGADVLIRGPQPEGTPLVDFRVDERHAETVSDTGAFEDAEGIYSDVDRSRTVTPGDIRLSVATFPDGSVVSPGDADIVVPPRQLRQFVFWGNVRMPNAAKNGLQVGAIATDGPLAPPWSSRGPTDDGRTKPDLLAAGTAIGLLQSTYPRNRYGGTEGTSIATGAAAGSAALLTHWLKDACSVAGPTPDVLKALFIHGAEDFNLAGARAFPGPDFVSGFGRLRVRQSVDLVPFHVKRTMSGLPDAMTVTIGRMQPLKVTLVWSDPSWTPNAQPLAHGVLQNDLDLVLIAPDGTTHTPWVLDPANPGSAAMRSQFASAGSVPDIARDRRNTVEQVVVDNAQAGVWTIQVTAAKLAYPPQEYTVVSEALPSAPSPCVSAPAADVWLRDNATDTGVVPSSGLLWLSPDLWNRRDADGLTAHENPEHGQPNFLYATVRNASAVQVKATTIEMWIADASTGLSWPTDFTYVGRILVPNLSPMEARQIGPLEWLPPSPVLSDHFCMYLRVLSPQDPIAIAEGSSVGTNAQNSNNIAWRNVNVVDLQSSRSVTFVVRNTAARTEVVDLLFRVPGEFLRVGDVSVTLSPLASRWASASRQRAAGLAFLDPPSPVTDTPLSAPVRQPAMPGFRILASEATLPGFELRPGQAERVTVTFSSPQQISAAYDVDVTQRLGQQIVGGIRYIVRTGRRP